MFKRIWEHKTTHIIVVLIVFSITGTSVARVNSWILSFSPLDKYSLTWWLVSIPLMTLIYPFFLLSVAWLFGKFDYFLNKQKKLWAKIIGRKTDKADPK